MGVSFDCKYEKGFGTNGIVVVVTLLLVDLFFGGIKNEEKLNAISKIITCE